MRTLHGALRIPWFVITREVLKGLKMGVGGQLDCGDRNQAGLQPLFVCGVSSKSVYFRYKLGFNSIVTAVPVSSRTEVTSTL